MIRPVRIEHTQLEPTGITLFLYAEIALDEQQIIGRHAEILFHSKHGQRFFVHRTEITDRHPVILCLL